MSVHEDDPGYRAFAAVRAEGRTVRVFLDGIEQQRVVTADEREGWVRRHVLTADGQPQIDPDKPDMVWVEQVSGVVRIEIVEAA